MWDVVDGFAFRGLGLGKRDEDGRHSPNWHSPMSPLLVLRGMKVDPG